MTGLTLLIGTVVNLFSPAMSAGSLTLTSSPDEDAPLASEVVSVTPDGASAEGGTPLAVAVTPGRGTPMTLAVTSTERAPCSAEIAKALIPSIIQPFLTVLSFLNSVYFVQQTMIFFHHTTCPGLLVCHKETFKISVLYKKQKEEII